MKVSLIIRGHRGAPGRNERHIASPFTPSLSNLSNTAFPSRRELVVYADAILARHFLHRVVLLLL